MYLNFIGIPLEMSCTIEKALADAKALVERLRDHDDAAESLIEQTTALNKRVEAMKQVWFFFLVDSILKKAVRHLCIAWVIIFLIFSYFLMFYKTWKVVWSVGFNFRLSYHFVVSRWYIYMYVYSENCLFDYLFFWQSCILFRKYMNTLGSEIFDEDQIISFTNSDIFCSVSNFIM